MKKSKKNSKKNNRYIKATDSKKQRAVKFFDRCAALLLAVIIASLLVCFGKEYELSRPSVHGPALWFLHLAAWPLLFLPGAINNLSWAHNTAVMKYLIDGNPALLLAILACLLLGIFYILFRRYGLSWFGPSGLRSAGHFMLIFACWGIFQLAISAVIILKDTNTLIPFHPVKNDQVKTEAATDKK
ncbi:MAG: hypothetical protein E7047_06235 [Lentisphaerae bacterium]|nr:hypothetical protein [Lentisphaerota bacterium]